jgi:hypothetical protein
MKWRSDEILSEIRKCANKLGPRQGKLRAIFFDLVLLLTEKSVMLSYPIPTKATLVQGARSYE